MSFEVERQLSSKADKWELHSLQSEKDGLKSRISELEKEVKELKDVNANRYYALERLFSIIAEHPQFSDLQTEIYQLKQNL